MADLMNIQIDCRVQGESDIGSLRDVDAFCRLSEEINALIDSDPDYRRICPSRRVSKVEVIAFHPRRSDV
jgi:hypothetical protein